LTSDVPQLVLASVEDALDELGLSDSISEARPIGGGCIHQGTVLTSERGDTYFLKWNEVVPQGMFTAEADGLEALREASSASRSGVIVPEPLAWREDEATAWLLMEYIPHGAGSAHASRALGEGLALIHGCGAEGPAGGTEPGGAAFGWRTENWIGSLPQSNPLTPSWGTFWRDARLAPQLARARGRGLLTDPRYDRVLERAPNALAHVRRPELVHGDLWNGNTFFSSAGHPVLIDPAIHWGDGELDLAMSELFGGFGPDFYAAYRAVRPVSEAYAAYARDLYQLYFLLVHVNLFGGAYTRDADRSAARVLAALGG